MNYFSNLKRVLTPDAQLYPTPDKAVWNSPMIPSHTPDMCVLEEYQFQNMFVYGNMMRNMPQHSQIGDGSTFLAVGFTAKPYKMFKKELGRESYPVALEASENERMIERYEDGRKIFRGPALIKGELFKVRPAQFAAIDKAMENGVLFERRRVRILVPTNEITIIRKKKFGEVPQLVEEQKLFELRAWTYVGTDIWNDKVADQYVGYKPPSYLLPPLTIHKPNNQQLKPYYLFTPADAQ